jgi:NTE family protein
LGYRRASGKYEVSTGIPAPDYDADIGQLFVRLFADTYDNLYFPRHGFFSKVEYSASREQYGATSDYDQWLVSFAHAFSWERNTLIAAIIGATTEDDNASPEGLFELGGFLRLSGLYEDQLSGQHAGLAGLVYMRNLGDQGLLKLFNSYAGVSLEMGNVWQTTDDISADNSIVSGSVFLGFDTPIGPLYLAHGMTDTDEQSTYIFLGPRFSF